MHTLKLMDMELTRTMRLVKVPILKLTLVLRRTNVNPSRLIIQSTLQTPQILM